MNFGRAIGISSFRFPLRAGGTEPVRGSPREAGGTNVNSGSAIGIMECGGEASAHAKADAPALQRLGVRLPLPHRVGEGQGTYTNRATKVCKNKRN
jgi:hypothetical protein